MRFRRFFALAALIVVGAAQAQNPPTPPAGDTAPASAPAAAASPAGGETKPGEAAAPAAPTQPEGSPVAMRGDAKAGEGKAAACGACHGPDGNAPSSQYPKLAGQNEAYVARQLVLFKTTKRQNPIMIGFAAPLSPQDMHDIGAYFATKNVIPGVADQSVLDRGQALYRGGDAKLGVPACMACHGPDGRGNAGSGYPELTGQYADYIGAKLKEWRAGAHWGDDDRAKIMPTIAQRLTDADVAALSSYIEGLHTATATDLATTAKPVDSAQKATQN